MDQPTENHATEEESFSLRPRLSTLIKGWRALSASEQEKAETAADAILQERLKSRADVFELCAADLESVIKSHAFDQIRPGTGAKPSQRFVRGRVRSNKLKDRLVDLALILMFLASIAGCVYLIIKIMTRWVVKGLG